MAIEFKCAKKEEIPAEHLSFYATNGCGLLERGST